MKQVPRYPPHGDASVPYSQSTGYVPSSPLVPMSPSTFYADLSTTTTPTWTSDTPYLASTSTSTDYGFPTSSPSGPPPSTTDGPAAVSSFTGLLSTHDSTVSSFSTIIVSTATTKATSGTSTNRTAIIASITVGLSALLLLLLLAFLFYRRRRRRTVQLEPRINSRALQSALLHDDEMARNANIGIAPATMAQYQDQNSDAGGAAAAAYRSVSPSHSILRSRVSESGSIFREEVWPPPSPTIDPIQLRSSQVDLSRIVDDVMGPASDENNNAVSETRKGHKRELTASSTTPLLVERQMSLTSSGHGSSEEDSIHVYASPSSLYSFALPIPPVVDQPNLRPYGEAFPPVLHASRSQGFNPSSSVTSISSSSHSTLAPSLNIQSSSSFRPPSIGSRTQPKVSSPLVRALPGLGGR